MNKIPAKYKILLGVFPATLILDQWTKYLIISHFRLYEIRDVIANVFALTYVRNRGAAFSLLDSAPAYFRDPFFLALPVVALVIIGVIFYRLPDDKKLGALCISLIASGATGNFIDRLRFGFVIDFIDWHWKEVYHWPRFNIADSCIVIGVSLLIIQSLFQPKES